MKNLRLLAWLLLSMLVLLVSAIGFLPFYLQAHKADLEAAASDALGRPVAIDGAGLGWLLRPRPGLSIVLNGLRVSNPQWDTDKTLGPHLLEAERVDVTWQLSALLHRQVRIDQVVIRGASLMLQKTADGRDNWQLGKDEDRDKDRGKGSSTISLRIPTVQLTDSRITFAVPKAPVRRVDITRLQLDGLGTEPLVLQAELSINETPLTLNARAGAAEAPTGASWPFQLQAQSGDSRIELNGSAPAPFATTGLDAKLRAQGPTAVPLGKIAGVNGLPPGPFQLETRLSWDGKTFAASEITGSSQAHVLPATLTIGDGEISVPLHGPWAVQMTGKLGDQPATLQLTPVAVPKGDTRTPETKTAGALKIEATLADGRFDGELRPASGDSRALLSGKLKAGTVRLPHGAQIKASKPDAKATTAAALTKTKANTKVPEAPTWADKPLPFSSLTRIDADLDLAVEALTWQRITLRGMQVQARLRDGRLQLNGVRLRLPGWTVSGQALVDAGPKVPALQLKLNTDRIDLPQALSMLAQGPKLGGSIDGLSLHAAASGATPATLIRALSATLEAQSIHLLPPAKRGQKPMAIDLASPSLHVDPGQPVSFKTGLARSGQTMDLALTGGTLADLLPDGRSWPKIDVVSQTRIDRQRLNISGHVGPFAAILTGRDLTLDLSLAVDTDLTATLTGTLARLDDLAGSQLRAQVNTTSLAALHPGLPAQALSAKARLQGQAKQLELLDIEANSGSSDIAGEVRIGLGEPLRIDATLNAETLDLSPFLAGRSDSHSAPAGAGAPTGADAVNAQTLPLDGLKALDGSLKLNAGDVEFGDFVIDQGTLDARLDAGHLVLSANAAEGGLSFDLALQPGQTDWKLNLHHKGKLNLGRLMKAKNPQALSGVPVTVAMRLNAAGASVPALLGSADGNLQLILGAGQLDRKASKLPFGRVMFNLLDTVNPTQVSAVNIRKDLLSLQCAVVQFEFADGIATSTHGLALQTDQLNVLGGGSIKLETEEIELRFKTVKRGGFDPSLLSVADRFIILDGTLKHPRAKVDKGDLLIDGAAAWASGGLSLVGDQLIQRLTGSGSPCETVLRRDALDPQP